MNPLADLYKFTATPVFSLWILIPGLILVLILSVLLYFDQKRIAPRSTVILLTLVRAALIVLLSILFLQPSLRWYGARTTAGTLWLVVDQSPSMQTPDPQALPGERVHWAEGMGLVAEDTRDDRPDVIAAKIHRLGGEFAALAPNVDPEAPSERPAVADFAQRLTSWVDDLDKVAAVVDRNRTRLDAMAPSLGTVDKQGAGGHIAQELHYAADYTRSDISSVRSASTARDAAGALRRFAIVRALIDAERYANAAVPGEDSTFLRTHKADPDLVAGTARVVNATRQDLAYGFLTAPDSVGAKPLAELAKKYNLRLAGFSDRASAAGIGAAVDPASIPNSLITALSPSGQGTDLDAALRYVSDQIASDEAASVIIVSDGRNNVPGDPTGPARSLAARGVHVYGLLIGSHEVSPDAAVDQIDNAPSWIYKGDSVKPRALVRLDGLTGKDATVQLLRDGEVVDSKTLKADQPHTLKPVEFSDKPPDSALAVEYQVRVSEMPGEVNTQNNSTTFRVEIKKDKLYALIIEDRPRWEFRYLATELARDERLKIQTILENPVIVSPPPAPVRASPDNPLTEAQLLPVTTAEWQAFDIIVLGDISPDVLPVTAQQGIAAAVRDKGATLITIAGQRSMPAKFTDSPLAELLPVTLDGQWTPEEIARHSLNGFRPAVAPTASVSVMAQFDVDPLNNTRLWESAPLWYWHSPYTQIKPAAQAIWTIEELLPAAPVPGARGTNATPIAAANRHALLATMSVGLGKSLYLASDQTWRLRQVSGADIHNRFWGQVLRWAVGSDLPAGGKFVRFGANKPSYSQDEAATITARVLRDDLTPYTGLSFSAVARAVAPKTGEGATQPAGPAVEARFTPLDSPGYYTATLGGLPVGDVEISLKGGEVERLLNTDPSVTQRTLLIKVEPTMNNERRNMNTDPDFLDTVAKAGGGYSIDGQYADVLLSHLPAIQHTETVATQFGFFTDPEAWGTKAAHWTFLGLFALLITFEWILRKRAGLV